MDIRYDDIKHRLQPPLDCAGIKDLRGQFFHNRIIINYENTYFAGCVFYHCWPSGFRNALEITPAKSEDEVTLEGANLQGADFEEANLQGANLKGANLQGANLEGTNLYRANLQGANLEGAHLREANLEGADLQRANLEGAYLRDADLRWANLRGADLRGANLSWAEYDSETILPDTLTQEQLGSMTHIEDDYVD